MADEIPSREQRELISIDKDVTVSHNRTYIER